MPAFSSTHLVVFPIQVSYYIYRLNGQGNEYSPHIPSPPSVLKWILLYWYGMFTGVEVWSTFFNYWVCSFLTMWLLASLPMNSLIYRTPAEHQPVILPFLFSSLIQNKSIGISVFWASSCLNFPWFWSPAFASCVVYFPIYVDGGSPSLKTHMEQRVYPVSPNLRRALNQGFSWWQW